MKELIQSWLNNEIDGDIIVDGRNFTLEYREERYEVWEDGELIAWNDNYKDFINVGSFIGIAE